MSRPIRQAITANTTPRAHDHAARVARLLARALTICGLLVVTLLSAGCLDPVVGYKCETGFSVCGETCVDLSRSALHCGACNVQCKGPCREGICLAKAADADPPLPDAPIVTPDGPPAGTPDADSPEVAKPTGDAGDARRDVAADGADGGTDARLDVASDGNGDAPVDANDGGDAGTNPNDAPQDMATPDLAGVPDAPTVDLPPGADVPPVVCGAGQIACSNRCVVLATDPDNCGGCGTRCGSGLCAAGICLQQGAGHLVVIGHDYVVNRSAMNNLLGNAVFLSASDPVAVLAFEGHASAAAIAGTNFAIDQVAADRGRHWQRTVGNSISVANDLLGYDVLLIYAQEDSVDQTLNDAGLAWDAAMTAFLAQGKTVVLLDGPSTTNLGTFQIVRAAGLFMASGRAEVTGQTLTVASPADAVALRVPRTYRAEVSSVGFTTTESNKVVTTAGGAAVVVHRTF
jgi:hypothetical protein